jgi:probable phosphoglycerate mutase
VSISRTRAGTRRGAWLRGLPGTLSALSTAARAAETAQILAEPHRHTLKPRDGLRQISHGHWEGLTRREVEERYAKEYAA